MDIAILHFQPIEGYPPILNFLSFLETRGTGNTQCITTSAELGYVSRFKGVKIRRLGRSRGSGKRLSYLLFNLFGLWYLFSNHPDKVLCFETLSSWPAYIYKKYINPGSALYIHYHEYTSLHEYDKGMKLARYFHQKEKWLYERADWISHTNRFRLEKFINDENLLDLPRQVFHVMPNFPPESWKNAQKSMKSNSNKKKIIYAGYGLSFDTMFVREIFDWIKERSDVSLDFYLHKRDRQIERYVAELDILNIHFFEALPYAGLPEILGNYDIGLIIYKGAVDNYIYNAPNKLFEYLACGLDVWLPKQMLGALEYVCENARPSVLALDFEKMADYEEGYLFRSERLPERDINYFCEPIYEDFYHQLIEKA